MRGSAVAMSIAKKNKSIVNKLVLITPFSWLGGAVYNDKLAFKIFVSFVRIRERLFPNFNPKSKFSFLRKSNAINDEYTEWAWNNLHKSKDDFIYADGGRFVVPYLSALVLGSHLRVCFIKIFLQVLST